MVMQLGRINKMLYNIIVKKVLTLWIKNSLNLVNYS